MKLVIDGIEIIDPKQIDIYTDRAGETIPPVRLTFHGGTIYTESVTVATPDAGTERGGEYGLVLTGQWTPVIDAVGIN